LTRLHVSDAVPVLVIVETKIEPVLKQVAVRAGDAGNRGARWRRRYTDGAEDVACGRPRRIFFVS